MDTINTALNWCGVCPLELGGVAHANLEKLRAQNRLLLTVTDNAMAERYIKDDTVLIRLGAPDWDGKDCLVAADGALMLRNARLDGEAVVLRRYCPELEISLPKACVEILGRAEGILRV